MVPECAKPPCVLMLSQCVFHFLCLFCIPLVCDVSKVAEALFLREQAGPWQQGWCTHASCGRTPAAASPHLLQAADTQTEMECKRMFIYSTSRFCSGKHCVRSYAGSTQLYHILWLSNLLRGILKEAVITVQGFLNAYFHILLCHMTWG